MIVSAESAHTLLSLSGTHSCLPLLTKVIMLRGQKSLHCKPEEGLLAQSEAKCEGKTSTTSLPLPPLAVFLSQATQRRFLLLGRRVLPGVLRGPTLPLLPWQPLHGAIQMRVPVTQKRGAQAPRRPCQSLSPCSEMPSMIRWLIW